MKIKKKLYLKKMSITQLDAIKGGNWDWPIRDHDLPTADPDGCGNGTQGLACQYSASPTSCVYCV